VAGVRLPAEKHNELDRGPYHGNLTNQLGRN
jgi:hypothetical protein